MIKKSFIAYIMAVAVISAAAQTDKSSDMHSISLDSIVVKGYKVSSHLRNTANGTALWNMKMMDELPKILGNADPMHYTQLLPSVQTNNEYDSGFHVQGCDNGHNLVSIEGVPLYNVSHLIGLFSVFNASHYPALQLQTSAKDASYPNRLGGFLTMKLAEDIQDSIDGEFAIGLISSQGTLRLPINKKHQLTFSLRASYLNLLYSKWLEMDGVAVNYSFYDSNLTYLYKPNSRDILKLDCYLGNDNGLVGIKDYGGDLQAKWGNHSIAAHWNHEGNKYRMDNTFYNTYFHNRYTLNMNTLNISLPSSICDFGFKNNVQSGNAHFGFETIYHIIKPQNPDIDVSYFNPSAKTSMTTTRSVEASMFYDVSFPIAKRIVFEPGLRASIYMVDNHNKYALDPSVSLTWETLPQWTNRIGMAWRHQYLLQTGINSMGLPTTFWISTGVSGIPVQSQQSIHYISNVNLQRGRYSLSVELYYKWLQHQQEYFGTFYDFINTTYDIRDMLHHGRGRNYGVNLTINKLKGTLTGWLSYSYGRALRQFTELGNDRWYPSNHERIHELNIVGTQKLGKRWSIGMTGVWAMGTPFTAPRNFQIINANIISTYGEHNANRLPPYFRIDVSANYRIKTRRFKESGVNISVYNLAYRSNDIFYYMKVHDERFYYTGVSFITRILPSISYYCKF